MPDFLISLLFSAHGVIRDSMCIIALTYELDEHVSCVWGNMLIYESINIWKIQLVCITKGL